MFKNPGELLNYTLLLVQFVQTDKFLNGHFSWYGTDTIAYLSLPHGARKNAVYKQYEHDL